jgi:hypothetical protein
MNETLFARNIPKSCKLLTCLPCTVDTAMLHNLLWHSRLPLTNKGNLLRNRNTAFFGAVYDLCYYAVAIWTTPVAANRMKNGFDMLELRRLAIAPDAPKYTATWMLGKMVRHIKTHYPHIIKLVSYQDTEVHTGTIYKAGNWVLESQTKYMDWSTEQRKRSAIVQSRAAKNRWAYSILDPKE